MSDKLVDNLITEVRALADEDNVTDVSDANITASLNRGQQKLVRLAARHYEPMFMRELTTSSFDGTDSREITIPDAAFGLIIDQIDIIQNNRSYRVYPAPIRHMVELEVSNSTTTLPWYYSIRGNKVLLYPTPSSGTSVRVRYQIRPPKLDKTQGRITAFDETNETVTLDSIGSDLTTSIDNLNAFVNIIDGDNGLVKNTLQISNIDTDSKVVTFKTASLDRSTVFGRTVATALPTDIALDDYLAIADSTCVPTLVQDYSDFLIQYAVVETLRRLGVPSQEAYAHLKELESDVKAMWAGRPSTMKVTAKNKQWSSSRLNKGRKIKS